MRAGCVPCHSCPRTYRGSCQVQVPALVHRAAGESGAAGEGGPVGGGGGGSQPPAPRSVATLSLSAQGVGSRVKGFSFFLFLPFLTVMLCAWCRALWVSSRKLRDEALAEPEALSSPRDSSLAPAISLRNLVVSQGCFGLLFFFKITSFFYPAALLPSLWARAHSCFMYLFSLSLLPTLEPTILIMCSMCLPFCSYVFCAWNLVLCQW